MSYRINQDCKITFTSETYSILFDKADRVYDTETGGTKYVKVRAVALDADWVQVQRMDGSKVFIPAIAVKHVEHNSLIP